MTLTEFRSRPALVKDLKDFLETPGGVALRSVMNEEHPVRKLAHSGANDAGSIRAAAKLEGESDEALLGRLIGWECLAKLITRDAITEQQTPTPRSRKAGGQGFKPEPAPRA